MYKCGVYLADVISDLALIYAISETISYGKLTLKKFDPGEVEKKNFTADGLGTEFANCTNSSDGTLEENMNFLVDVLEKYRLQLILAFMFSILKQLKIANDYIQVRI